jgi:hypothetical protein
MIDDFAVVAVLACMARASGRKAQRRQTRVLTLLEYLSIAASEAAPVSIWCGQAIL